MTDTDNTEWQMLTKVGKKFAALFFFLLIIDDLFDWLIELIGLAFELSYVIFEVIAYLFEMALANTLHTDHRQSEIIFVYISVMIALYGLYRLYFAIPRWYFRWKRNLQSACVMLIRHEASYWQTLSLTRKIKLVTAYTLGTVCFIFLLTI